jgi:hypothetical protein
MDDRQRLEARIAAIATRWYGLISHGAARRAGMTEAQIRHRVDRGLWIRIVPGVYQVAGTPESYQHATLAAVLVAGRDAVASHMTAGALNGAGAPPIVPHITVPKTKSARTRIAVVHRSAVSDVDRTFIGPIPVTTPARVLVDCAPLVPFADLCSLTDTFLTYRKASSADVLGAIRRAGRGRHGIPKVMAALHVWVGGIRPGSPAEARLLRRLDEWGFPPPERQLEVTDERGATIARLDLAWPAWRTALEYQGELAHGPRDEVHDEARLSAVVAQGWWVGEVYKEDLRPSSRRLRDEVLPRLRRPRAA